MRAPSPRICALYASALCSCIDTWNGITISIGDASAEIVCGHTYRDGSRDNKRDWSEIINLSFLSFDEKIESENGVEIRQKSH